MSSPRTARSAFAAALTIVLVSTRARADAPFVTPATTRADETDDASFRAFLVGSLTAAVPFAVGTTITTSTNEQAVHNAGVYTLQSGLLVAPLVTHGMLGEWQRGAWFTLAPAAASGGMIALLAVDPDAVTHASLDVQRLYYALVITSVLGGGAGVVDGLFHPYRDPPRARGSQRGDGRDSLSLTPLVGRGVYGLSLGGTL